MVPPLVKQVWTASGVILNLFAQGMVLAYPSCLLPGLQAPDSTIKIDLETGSWLASAVGISSMFGTLVSSYLMERFGRRVSHILMLTPSLVGSLMIHFSTNVTMLMIGRITTGISVGSTIILGAIIIGEYTSPENRGLFLNIKNTAVYIGATVLHVLGNYYHWRTVALICSIPSFISLVSNFTWTESPSWLASKSQFRKSEETFYCLRGYSEKSIKEFEAMVRAQKARNVLVDGNKSCSVAVLDYFKRITQKDFLKPLMITGVAHILLEACGRHTFSAYATDIVKGILVTPIRSNTFTYTLAIDILATVSATFSCVLVKRMKRRNLLFLSGISCMVTAMLLSTYLCLVDNELISDSRPWIPMLILSMLFVFANLGCSPIPLTLMGELFPLPHRAMGSGVSGFTASLAFLLALKLWPTLVSLVNLSGTFAVSAAVMGACQIYLYFYLPETKDKTLQEIEDFFNHGRFIDDDEVTQVMMVSNKAALKRDLGE